MGPETASAGVRIAGTAPSAVSPRALPSVLRGAALLSLALLCWHPARAESTPAATADRAAPAVQDTREGHPPLRRRRPGGIEPTTVSKAEQTEADRLDEELQDRQNEEDDFRLRDEIPEEDVGAEPEDPNGETGLAAVPAPDHQKPPEIGIIADRWKLPGDLGLMTERWYDPYNFNVWKADRPLIGRDWFFNVGAISDTIAEPRQLPPTLASGSRAAGDQFLLVHNLILAFNAYKGETVYRPPDIDFRFSPVINTNYTEADAPGVLYNNPAKGQSRTDTGINFQQLSLDLHLRTVSDRYDFDRVRFGIQPFTADFRGFLFLDNPLGVRLYGTRDSNLWQYNLAWFNRIEKNVNSGLNEVIEQGLRGDQIVMANLYRQDFPVRGFILQGLAAYNRNREGNQGAVTDPNGFSARPANFGGAFRSNYDVGYLGLNGDGHFDRLNVTASTYYAVGSETASPFTGKQSTIAAWFAAAEFSMDFDWIRPRVSILHGSGDDNPYDSTSGGYDAIFENPVFAGGDTTFWVRQSMPYSKGVKLMGRNGILNSLRSSKEQGQSNFTNPGIQLYGVGADFDVLPELKLFFNVNKLFFDDTSVLEATSNHRRIRNDIGWDTSVAFFYRPFQTQNVIFRLSGAILWPGDGWKDLYGDHPGYSVLANLILAY